MHKQNETRSEFREFVTHLHHSMTPTEKSLQALDFAYGNLACTTNHKPRRDVFRELARTRGISDEEFREWERDKVWKETVL